jgi:hypothetical protein
VVVLVPPNVLVVVDDGNELPVDPVPVEVVVVGVVVVVVVDDELVVVVVVVGVVVVVVVGTGRVGAGVLKTPPTVVPLEWPPKRSANGRPAMSSIPVTRSSEKTNTPSATAATMDQRSPDRGGVGLGSTSGVGAVSCSVGDGMVSAATAPSAWVALVAVSSVSAEEPEGSASVTPAAVVPPNRRRSFVVSGTRTTTCLTAWFVRSIDWTSSAVPVVAATEPMATPTMVPLTPKMEAITADNTAPPAEARICR